MVRNAWGKGNHQVPVSLEQVKADSLKFTKEIFDNIFHQKKALEGQLRLVQWKLEIVDSVLLALKELQQTYMDVFKLEKLL